MAMLTEAIIRKTCKELDIEVIDMAVNPDHVHIFIKYPPKYSVSYISNMIKGISSRVLRKEFLHLKEWCCDHLWAATTALWALAGTWLRNISRHIIHMSITGDNPEKHYIQARDICPGYTGDCKKWLSCASFYLHSTRHHYYSLFILFINSAPKSYTFLACLRNSSISTPPKKLSL